QPLVAKTEASLKNSTHRARKSRSGKFKRPDELMRFICPAGTSPHFWRRTSKVAFNDASAPGCSVENAIILSLTSQSLMSGSADVIVANSRPPILGGDNEENR